jgi:hypothetical protein
MSTQLTEFAKKKQLGIDDGWQECGAGSELPTSFHNSSGTPLVNESKFPDLKILGEYAEKRSVTLGW